MTADKTPRKLYLGALTDNRRWDSVELRPDDVIVATPPKCGTTWMQTIVALLFSGDPDVETELSIRMPWVDMRLREMAEVADRLAAMTHRRCMKSHTPLDGLPLRDETHYVCVFRHPLDAHFSFRNHAANIPLPWFDHWYPEDDPDGIAFRRFLDGGPEGFDLDAAPLATILKHYKAAKALADCPNVALFHYADMKRDLAGVFAELADLLNTPHPQAVMERLVSAATFDNMRQHAERFAPSGGKGFFKSDADFFHRGTSNQWHGRLSDRDLAAYDRAMDASLSPQDRAWLEYGSVGQPAQD